MSRSSRLFCTLIFAVLLGALILGAGGRAIMRLLALSIDRPTGFSLWGSLEIIAYGALLGLGGGLISFAVGGLKKGKSGGIFVGLMTYLMAVVTLPGHIAETATPFAGRMWLVHGLFGLAFIAFGVALSMATSSSRFAKATHRH